MPSLQRSRRATRNGTIRIVAVAVLFGGCSWFTDFKQQPDVDPWESVSDTIPFRGNPQYSVPMTGTHAAAFQVSYAPLPATIDSMSGIANPVAPDARSLANGRKYYAINCAVCHGDKGVGDGPASKYGLPGINIVSPVTQARTDGYIFGMIRNGRGLMPNYNRIEESDRWDVVNYVRGLQGRHTVQTGPVGRPGETGDAVPRATTLGPTRPARHSVTAAALDTLSTGAAGDTAAARRAGAATLPTDTTGARRRSPQEPTP
jgi:mono/diheme cytochrome c family protein